MEPVTIRELRQNWPSAKRFDPAGVPSPRSAGKQGSLFTFDFADYDRFEAAWSLKAGGPCGTTTLVPGQPVDYFVPPYDTINCVNG
ncbi:MAG: hypothetical protein EXS37_19565 [Opitutus sp.]|nr:hypothetical protein [Opitutus sp.]